MWHFTKRNKRSENKIMRPPHMWGLQMGSHFLSTGCEKVKLTAPGLFVAWKQKQNLTLLRQSEGFNYWQCSFTKVWEITGATWSGIRKQTVPELNDVGLFETRQLLKGIFNLEGRDRSWSSFYCFQHWTYSMSTVQNPVPASNKSTIASNGNWTQNLAGQFYHRKNKQALKHW